LRLWLIVILNGLGFHSDLILKKKVFFEFLHSITLPLMVTEAFPSFSGAYAAPHPEGSSADKARRRRKSSSLGGEIRAGDTGPAFATLNHRKLPHSTHKVSSIYLPA
jgi:hypothetical protein